MRLAQKGGVLKSWIGASFGAAGAFVLLLALVGSAKAHPPIPSQHRTTQPANPGETRYRANQDVEVGEFYLHKGDPDAAIGRFKDAAQLRPDWGKPRLLLGKAFERKHDPENAVKYYREYLRVYPKAPDRKKIEGKISKLSRD